MFIPNLIAATFFLFAGVRLSAVDGSRAQLKELCDNKQYFELREALASHPNDKSTELLFYRGVVSNKFNQLQASLGYLQSYLLRTKNRDEGTRLTECYETLADNYLKTYQYRQAAEAYSTILARFRAKIDDEEAADHENAVTLWNALGDVSPQTVSFNGDSKIQTVKDAAELTTLPAMINGEKINLVFDTGANLSVLASSLAKRLGLNIIDVPINVGGITGNQAKARLGVARELKIGNVMLRQVVFLVFDDTDIYIAPIAHQLTGLIGFPVIAALREITFARNGEMTITAKPVKRGEPNMCLDGLSPLLVGTFRGKKLTFTFDSGANKTDLHPPFFKAYEHEITANYTAQPEKLTGVGSSREVAAYRLKDLEMNFSGKTARFSEVKLLTEATTGGSRYFYGNLGQDLIRRFERMTISFESMSLVFE